MTTSIEPHPPLIRRRWFVAVIVIGVVALATLLGVEVFTDDVPSQVEWSIMLSDVDEVVLKGDLPDGYPMETWLNGELLSRDEEGDFTWDSESGVPDPVHLIEAIEDCAPLFDEMSFWMSGSQSAANEASELRHLAFAQAAIEQMSRIGCDSSTDEPGGGQ